MVVPPPFVLKYTMMGQRWIDGHIAFHSKISADTLLIHGQHDQLVPLAETALMQRVFKWFLVLVEVSS
jgi:hypothetical protein